jgi:hypothetical protein
MAAVQQITTDSHMSRVAISGTGTAIASGAGTGLRPIAFIEMKWRNSWSAAAMFEGEFSRNMSACRRRADIDEAPSHFRE